MHQITPTQTTSILRHFGIFSFLNEELFLPLTVSLHNIISMDVLGPRIHHISCHIFKKIVIIFEPEIDKVKLTNFREPDI